MVCALLAASPAAAQDHRLPAAEVAQIADEALSVVVPRSLKVTGIPLVTRTVAFDARATLDAFGDSTAPDSTFHLPRTVTIAPPHVLHDCSQIAPQPCAGIGSRVYVVMEPVSIARSRAHVRVTVLFATRVQRSDTTMTSNGYLSGYSNTLWFVRRGDGAWAFAGEGDSSVVF